MIRAGLRFTFFSPYRGGPVGWTDEAFAARIGTEAEVLGLAPEDDYDRDEVGDMYEIRFLADGRHMTAWPEEIDPTLIRGWVV